MRNTLILVQKETMKGLCYAFFFDFQAGLDCLFWVFDSSGSRCCAPLQLEWVMCVCGELSTGWLSGTAELGGHITCCVTSRFLEWKNSSIFNEPEEVLIETIETKTITNRIFWAILIDLDTTHLGTKFLKLIYIWVFFAKNAHSAHV